MGGRCKTSDTNRVNEVATRKDSASQLNEFFKCPYAYKLIHIDKVPITVVPNPKKDMGTCVHLIISNYFRQVKGNPPTVSEMKSTLEAMFNHFFDPKLEPYKKEIKEMLNNFLKFEIGRINNWIRPILIENGLEDDEFYGIIDYFDGWQVIDWKTGAVMNIGPSEQRQGKIYERLCTKYVAELPEEIKKRCSPNGYKVYFATLKNGRVLEMPKVTDGWLIQQRREKQRIIASGRFNKIRSYLCNWCSVQVVCEFDDKTIWDGMGMPLLEVPA